MGRPLRLPLLALLLALGAGAPLRSAASGGRTEVPDAPPSRWVTDGAGLLSSAVREELDGRLETFERTTGHQVVVWIGRSTGLVPIEDWAERAFRRWEIGRRGADDGLALFVMTEDRVARIEVGYGLEERVPDARARRIIDEELAPRLAAGDGDGAIAATVDALLRTIGGAGAADGVRPLPAAPPAPVELTGAQKVVGAIVLAIFLYLFFRHPALLLYFLSSIDSGRRTRGGHGWGGSVGGWGGGSGWGGSGGGFHGGGGRSGGGGATGRW